MTLDKFDVFGVADDFKDVGNGTSLMEIKMCLRGIRELQITHHLSLRNVLS